MTDAVTQSVGLDPGPNSWTAPGETDVFATYGMIGLLFLVFCMIYLYALFDRYAHHKGTGTPLRTTIPTMLTVGLAYDILPPLEGVNFLLPLALIVAAAARDAVVWATEYKASRGEETEEAETPVDAAPPPRAAPARPAAAEGQDG